MQQIYCDSVSHDLRSPLAHAIILTDKIRSLFNNPVSSISVEDVTSKLDHVRSFIMRVHFKILDFIDLSSVERNEFKEKNFYFDVRETILMVKKINSL